MIKRLVFMLFACAVWGAGQQQDVGHIPYRTPADVRVLHCDKKYQYESMGAGGWVHVPGIGYVCDSADGCWKVCREKSAVITQREWDKQRRRLNELEQFRRSICKGSSSGVLFTCKP